MTATSVGANAPVGACSDGERECRLVITRRAEERFDELAGMVLSAILAELPEYGRGRSAIELEDMAAGVRRSVAVCLRAVAEDRGLDDDERRALRLTGAQRARQGVPKAAVAASVRIATRIGRRFLLACGDDADHRFLGAAFGAVVAAVDHLEDELAAALEEGHDEGRRDVLFGGDRSEAVLVDQLLEQRFVDVDDVLQHAAHVGLSPSQDAYTAVVVLTASGDDEAGVRRRVRALHPRVQVAAGPLRCAPRPHLPVLLQPRSAAPGEVLVSLLADIAVEASTVVVYSERARPLAAVGEPYASIRDGLPFVEAATDRPGAVPSLLVRFHRVLATGNSVERLHVMSEVLEPLYGLPQRERTELFETLDAWYETGGSAAALGRHLHVHKNTVFRRMRRVRELVGLDMRRPAERLVVEATLRMRRAHEMGCLHIDGPPKMTVSSLAGLPDAGGGATGPIDGTGTGSVGP